jgi:hypothetical protein
MMISVIATGVFMARCFPGWRDLSSQRLAGHGAVLAARRNASALRKLALPRARAQLPHMGWETTPMACRLIISIAATAVAACDRPPSRKQELIPPLKQTPRYVSEESPEFLGAFLKMAKIRDEAKIDDSDPSSEVSLIRSAEDRARVPEYLEAKRRYLAELRRSRLQFTAPTPRESEREIAVKESMAANARKRMDEMLQSGQITDPDVQSMSAAVHANPGAVFPDGSKATIESYLAQKAEYLANTVLAKAMRKSYEDEKGQGSK